MTSPVATSSAANSVVVPWRVYLRARVPRERIATIWAGPTETARFSREIKAFRDRLAALPPETPRVRRAAKAPEYTPDGPVLEETGS